MRWRRCVRKVVDFLSILLCFWGKPPSFFWRKSRVCFSLVTPGVFPYACRCAGADTRSRIAHSVSLKFLPSPFTFTTNGLIYSWLCVKDECFLVLHRWREAWGEAFTRKVLSISWLSSMGEEVKAKNEKRLTRAYTRAQWREWRRWCCWNLSCGGFFKRVTSDNR